MVDSNDPSAPRSSLTTTPGAVRPVKSTVPLVTLPSPSGSGRRVEAETGAESGRMRVEAPKFRAVIPRSTKLTRPSPVHIGAGGDTVCGRAALEGPSNGQEIRAIDLVIPIGISRQRDGQCVVARGPPFGTRTNGQGPGRTEAMVTLALPPRHVGTTRQDPHPAGGRRLQIRRPGIRNRLPSAARASTRSKTRPQSRVKIGRIDLNRDRVARRAGDPPLKFANPVTDE